ncbi:MAG: endonuclease/exonuclease/phosphatase family protein [Cytophagaceae bacterium]
MALVFILYFFSVLVIVFTIIPLFRLKHWWIRIFDFPRVQVLICQGICLHFHIIILDPYDYDEYAIPGLLLLAFGYQLFKIFPYTKFARKEVSESETSTRGIKISLLVTNVYRDNRRSELLLNVIRQASPDVILAIETNYWWMDVLSELKTVYKYTVEKPLDNTYGILLYSKYKLEHIGINYLVESSVPSIEADICLSEEVKIKFYGLHPKPPAPNESTSSKERDAELVIVANAGKNQKGPVIVAGDLNDVAWSRTTHEFQQISRLLDPRVGRGMYATFNSKNLFFRWPLDHVFISKHFTISRIKLLPHVGSDHFPIYVELKYILIDKPGNEALDVKSWLE